MWTTVFSWCFYWLHRDFLSFAENYTINLISVLTIWWCPYVESSLVLLEKGVCYEQCILLAKLCWPLSWFTLYSKAKSACYSRYLWLPIFVFQSPVMKKTSFFGSVLEGSVGLHKTVPNTASSALVFGAQIWIIVILNSLPLKWTKIILSVLRLHPSTAIQILLLTMRATRFLLRDSCP